MNTSFKSVLHEVQTPNHLNFNLEGYQILKLIHQGYKSLVYRGERTCDRKPVILKVLRSEYPRLQEMMQFKNQYFLTKNLNLPGIIKPIYLEKYQKSWVLVTPDNGCVSLDQYRQNFSLDLAYFFKIAISITQTLARLYSHRIIHKDIKPANIIIHPATQNVYLIDFSIASALPQEIQEIVNPNVLEGTLAYMSPEQTGRMNRGIDYRSDFYALGVTFYELLTGKLPFESTDPMELVHCHLATLPVPPIEINPEIPTVLSEIVMKLMAKNAEDRYQSAFGLKADLEACWKSWKINSNISHFELGSQDICDRFLIPEKLYGREEQVQKLLDAFSRVAGSEDHPASSNEETKIQDKGRSELMLVAGFSGIGKTAVINEVHKPIVQQKGYFIQGKFDQFKRDIPLSAFVQALRDLIQQLLSETEVNLQRWKAKILEALGENAQVLIDVIPELEKIVGSQPPVIELSGSAAQNRFNLLFQKFLQVFSQKEHPLVIFLDDLHWSDSASLKLIELLMTDYQSHHLLMIGAYRDNEVDAAHLLVRTLDEIQQAGGQVNRIILKSLEQNSLNQMIAETLKFSPKVALPLTQIVAQKTQGNPFFSRQFIKSLHQEGLINFQSQKGYWQCNLGEIKLLALSDDVVTFVANQLKKLKPETQQVLKLAACIGNSFDLETLAIIHEKSITETATDLWCALQEGLIVPRTEFYKFYITEEENFSSSRDSIHPSVTYKFLHDRVQQAAYFLIPEYQKKTTHLKIGKRLLQNLSEAEQEPKIFDIVNQFNQGIELINLETERQKLAELNLKAGQKAKRSTAYASAINYLKIGLELIPQDCWETQYDLTLALSTEMIEAQYLNTNFEEGFFWADIVLKKAQNILDQVKVQELKILMYAAQIEMLKAINTGLQFLNSLGVSLEKALPKIQNVDDLANLPYMTDSIQLSAQKILVALISPAYFVNPELFSQLIFTIIDLSIRYGNSSYSAYGYVLYGLFLCGVSDEIDTGYRYGKLALNLLEKFDNQESKCKILMVFNGNIRIWKESIDKTLQPLQEAYQIALESGDLEYACYSSINYVIAMFATEKNLTEFKERTNNILIFNQKIKQDYGIILCQIYLQFILKIQAKDQHQHQLSGSVFDETVMLPVFRKNQNAILLFHTYFVKGILFYLFQKHQEAVQAFAEAEQYIASVAGMVMVAQHNFYSSLALLACFKDDVTHDAYFLKVKENQKRMKLWADHAPENYQHKYHLVAAEMARSQGDKLQAVELYEQAITAAKENQYIQEEAIANELAAQFYLDWNKETIAQAYLTNAYYSYARWGAEAKVKDLEERYPQLLAHIFNQKANISESEKTVFHTSSQASCILDFSSVMKATQVISEEIECQQLISTLMKVILENSGARKGCLILSKNGNFVLEALAIVDDHSSSNTPVCILQSLPLEESSDVPISLINYVARTQQTFKIDHAKYDRQFARDPYFTQDQPQSIYCIPILKQSQLMGVLYLENNRIAGAFTEDRIEVLKIITTQAAISLENAQVYETLEQKVKERTQEINTKNKQLSQTIKQLKKTQEQLIHTEKMSSLGQMVAGIAHEINNPVNFIHGNLTHASEYAQDLLRMIQLYQKYYPNPPEEIQAELEAVELDFIEEDIYKIIRSMKQGTERIRKIVLSLRTFSRLDEAEVKMIDIHEGIESSLMMLQNRLNSSQNSSEINLIKNYSQLPKVKCYPAQLNQVFLNIFNNAIDSLEEANQQTRQIKIQTEVSQNQWVVIRIADNGSGIPEEIQSKIFDPFFTTKPVGKGTGLGLSTSYQIIVDKHHGQLTCHSQLGQGTEFVIRIPIEL